MIYEMSGVIGINPDPLTLRELIVMHKANLSEKWDRQSQLLCMVHNVNCAKKKDMKDPKDFHPFESKKRKKGTLITQKSFDAVFNSLKQSKSFSASELIANKRKAENNG